MSSKLSSSFSVVAQSWTSRRPGKSISSQPPGMTNNWRLVVVWRPRLSLARTALVRWRSSPRSEEHGFVGALFVLLLYFFVLMRLIQNAQTAADMSGSLIIMGVVAVLTFQIAVNVGMVIGFMP